MIHNALEEIFDRALFSELFSEIEITTTEFYGDVRKEIRIKHSDIQNIFDRAVLSRRKLWVNCNSKMEQEEVFTCLMNEWQIFAKRMGQHEADKVIIQQEGVKGGKYPVTILRTLHTQKSKF